MNVTTPPQYDAIADGLAENGFACVDHFLSETDVDAILGSDEFKAGLLQFRRAGTGRDKYIAEGVRGDYIRWVDPLTASPEMSIYLNCIPGLISFLNRALFLSLKDYEVHSTVYPVGSFYKRHLDQFKSTDHRKLSIICYLNKDWQNSDGGQLRVYAEHGALDFLPIAGRLVCFRSDLLEHEVLPASRERFSITGWILDQHASSGNL